MTRTRRETAWRLALVAVAVVATISVVTGRLAGGLTLAQGALLFADPRLDRRELLKRDRVPAERAVLIR